MCAPIVVGFGSLLGASAYVQQRKGMSLLRVELAQWFWWEIGL